ncbi:MAG: DUF362 domain-containing protein [Treponema sp.]|jgi:uncharacterized protein (DUF362 family)|nr:DUF362 domain-containing protein [Treponema sp.]
MKILSFFLLAVMMLNTGCANRSSTSTAVTQEANCDEQSVISTRLMSTIFVEDTDGTDDGVIRLVNSMQNHGLDFYSLITSNDVVILKINCQWAERGGTNTDLIRGVIQAITEHPHGFTGEVIIADNGQGQFGSDRRGGSLSWANANSACRRQSVMDVVRIFQGKGFHVTGVLWDEFTGVRVQEFSSGDTNDGFVVEDHIHSTGLEISYPKFTTEYGTNVSFKNGIWDTGTQTYISEKLKVINMPVLKSHGGFQVTAAVKNYMGTPSDRLTNRRAHNSVGVGGMGTQMAFTRVPVLNIIDMIWIGVERGPSSSYANAKQINKIAAAIDPVALDYWASKNILIPEVVNLPGGRAPSMNPDGAEPGTFGWWLRLSMEELHKEGIWATMDESEITVVGFEL